MAAPPYPSSQKKNDSLFSLTLFNDITFHIASSIAVHHAQDLATTLLKHGGRISQGIQDKKLNLVISNCEQWEGCDVIDSFKPMLNPEEREDKARAQTHSVDELWRSKVEVVTPPWIERSLLYGRLQSPEYFSPNPSKIFSGVIACGTVSLAANDVEVVSASIGISGGQWRQKLTRDITHVFATTSGGLMYDTAMQVQKTTGLKVVHPYWVFDSMRINLRGLPTIQYEWPNPPVLSEFMN